ncbi:hypothetical protein FRC04_005713 [Tulasnella sp. 424]|nr:hypothetical protein FRC04_005713 [Tulasnella sp. 424]KAG8977508.1 hypothetical protein FRC05_001366 [Tulasnella sp. 425]
MEAMSIPSDTSDTSDDEENLVINGIPFIKLPDKASDFAYVLHFIYNQSLPGNWAPFLSRSDLMGIIKFTGKYRIDQLRQWAISKLEEGHLLRTRDIPSKPSRVANLTSCMRPEDHIQTIHFARECSLPQYLPLAFYGLATHDPDLY